jgi:hypothetical protein
MMVVVRQREYWRTTHRPNYIHYGKKEENN